MWRRLKSEYNAATITHILYSSQQMTHSSQDVLSLNRVQAHVCPIPAIATTRYPSASSLSKTTRGGSSVRHSGLVGILYQSLRAGTGERGKGLQVVAQKGGLCGMQLVHQLRVGGMVADNGGSTFLHPGSMTIK